MSDINRDSSIRQLPPGKLTNIKKIFEDGEKDKPMAPTRPQVPPGSPAHQLPAKKYPAPPAPCGQVTKNSNEGNDELKFRKLSAESVQPQQSKQGAYHGSKISERISSLEAASSSKYNGANEAPGSPGHSENIKVQRAFSDVSDLYAKVNKPEKDSKATFQPRVELQRKEAIRKNSEERRKTVATFSCDVNHNSGVSVASRTKLFDSPKPNLPVKPEAIKRQFSTKAVQEQDQHNSDADGVYNQPWDTEKSPVVEALKKKYKPPLLSNKVTDNAKTNLPAQKPPLPQQPPRQTDLKIQRKQSQEAVAEVNRSSDQSKCVDSSSDTTGSSRITAPPKPPRTHAHDDYLKVKIAQSENKPYPESQDTKAVKLEVSSGALSVKDRVSKICQQTNSPLPTSSKDHAVLMRQQPPSRPPPPRLRPNSGGTPTKENPFQLKPRPVTHFTAPQDEGPVVIPSSPVSPFQSATLFSRKASQSRKPSDELPPEPLSSKRFPLRKSYSSENLHSSRSSSLNTEDDDGSQKTQSTYETDYEAVLDPDGYAIPHEFMKIHVHRKRQFSEQSNQMDENVSPAQFLTKLEGFGKNPEAEQNGQFDEPWLTSAQDQNLDKVTKRKMTMVKQKINQAYADVTIAFRCAPEKSSDIDSEWVQVEKDDSPEAEVIVEPTVLKRRIEYCATVRLKSSKSVKKSKEYLSAIYPQLFEYCLIVGLQTSTEKGYKPYIIHKFPENRTYKVGAAGNIYICLQEFLDYAVVSSNLSVPSFCFPDAAVFKVASGPIFSESYSFVMTYEDGTHVYGYCRRMQPSDSSLPEVICIISPIDAFNMYNTLLTEIEQRRRISTDLAIELIAASFGRPLPKPGKVCHIRTLVNYESPLRFLGTDKLVKVFASILMERRIMLCSSHLSVLTQTVHALAALLYPFQWQHVYIPLLPLEMLDVVCAPMPYIIGVMTAFLPQVLKMDLEKVFIVDLDKKDIVMSEGDESTLLPHKVQKALKTAINMCKIDSEAQNAQWLMVAEAFLRMFIETVGHFSNHIQTQQDGNRIFQKEGFINEVVSKEQRQFLEWFTETQMFQVFIDNHVEQTDYGTSALFMQRLAEYRESKEENRRKGLGAKVKNFKKALKTKLAS
uniref:UDENN domain-containing protein n=1 Tax=Biomphalaria glabrata TaxID=6526 RepID=A0A2C9KTX5_BIOGL